VNGFLRRGAFVRKDEKCINITLSYNKKTVGKLFFDGSNMLRKDSFMQGFIQFFADSVIKAIPTATKKIPRAINMYIMAFRFNGKTRNKYKTKMS